MQEIKSTLKRYALLRGINNFQRRLLDTYYWRVAKGEYEVKIARIKTVDDVLDETRNMKTSGYYSSPLALQNRYEIVTLTDRVNAIQPQVIVEIGTQQGGTLLIWGRCVPSVHLLISVDLPGGDYGKGYLAERSKLYELFVADRPEVRLELLRANSQVIATQKKVIDLLDGRSIDFLFLDADHRYEGVKKDYELYAPLVRSGGLIAFHDIRPNVDDPTIAVSKLWNEIVASGAQTEEIIEEPYCGRFGIGLQTKA